MHLKYTKKFLKHYQKRITANTSLNNKFKERLNLLILNPTNPVLKNHKLTGAKKYIYAFSITGDIRVLYKRDPVTIILVDIGTHNQVY